MILRLFAIGLLSMLAQVVLLRELNVAFYGSELIYILGLGSWLMWTAVGAATGRRSFRPTDRAVRTLLVVLALMLPLVLVAVRGVRLLLGATPGAYLSLPQQLGAIAFCLLPVSACLGLLFQWAAKLYVSPRRSLAAAYAIESAGGLVGAILATLLLAWGVQNFNTGLVCAALAALAALPSAIALAVATGLLALSIAAGTDIDRKTTSWNHPRLVETADSPYGRISITENAGQVSVFINDSLAYESENVEAEEFAHLVALQHPRPRSALVLGGGPGGLVRELLPFGIDQIDYVELDARLLELFERHGPLEILASFEAPQVNRIVADPRSFLGRTGRSYDLILIGMPEPESGQANRFYTREFFARCAARLDEGGVLGLRLRGAENLWTPHVARRAASVHKTLRSVFPDVVVLPGVTQTFLASASPLARDPEILTARMEALGVEGRLVVPDYVRYLYTNDRFAEIERVVGEVPAVLNTDTRPVCYQYTMWIWLSRFSPGLAMKELPQLRLGAWIGLGGLVLALLVSRLRPMWRRATLAGLAGCVGMVLETTLILHYQTQRGVLFQNLGLLLALFMVGLALGAAAVDRWGHRRGGLPRWSGVALVLALALLCLSTVLAFRYVGDTGATGTIGVLLLLTGVLTAGLFGVATLRGVTDQRSVVSPLYAADLVGGCLGSLVASLLLIPLAGLTGAALAAALLAAIALLVA